MRGGHLQEVSLITIWLKKEPIGVLVRWSLRKVPLYLTISINNTLLSSTSSKRCSQNSKLKVMINSRPWRFRQTECCHVFTSSQLWQVFLFLFLITTNQNTLNTQIRTVTQGYHCTVWLLLCTVLCTVQGYHCTVWLLLHVGNVLSQFYPIVKFHTVHVSPPKILIVPISTTP